MTEEFSPVKACNAMIEARAAAGMPAIEHSLVTIGQSCVFMSETGIKTIEWADMQNPACFNPSNKSVLESE